MSETLFLSIFQYSYNIISFTLIAVCPDACDNCASCYLPSMCTCDSGWQGNDCCTGKSITEIICIHQHCKHVDAYQYAYQYLVTQYLLYCNFTT